MKFRILLFIFISTIFSTKAQKGASYYDEFTYSTQGLKPDYYVIDAVDINQETLFLRSYNWIKYRQGIPDSRIQLNELKSQISYEGIKDEQICIYKESNRWCYYCTYKILLMFEDDQIKFIPINLSYPIGQTLATEFRMQSINLRGDNELYKNEEKIKRRFRDVPDGVESLFNELKENLEYYIRLVQTIDESNNKMDNYEGD